MKKIAWGILGCARIAERALIPAIREAANAELAGIAARDERRAREWAEQYHIGKAFKDYAALIDDRDIDAVYIPLPNHLHVEWAIRAAEAGKHVLCEKPLALTEGEARAMFGAAKKAGVLLMEAFMYRFHPRFERTLELVRAGEIGEILTFRSAFTFLFTSGRKDYRWSPEMGGGALYDIGCYPVSAARTVFGGEPASVFARARLHPECGIDLATSLLVEFSGGRQALLDCAFDTPFHSWFEIAGTNGRIALPRAFSAKHFDLPIDILKDDESKAILIPSSNQYVRMVEHFGESILRGTPLRYAAEDAFGNARLIDAAFRSLRLHRPVHLGASDEK
jgi:predicted dehydrogenase